MIKRSLIAAAILAFAAGPAFAGSCPKDMKAIDAYMSKHAMTDTAMMSKVKDLRAKGESLHKSGHHKESVAALHQAKKLLGM